MGGFILLALDCRGALWESPNWALTGDAGEAAGYDSNLTFSHDGEGDGFETTDADLLLARLHSPFLTNFKASAAETVFVSDRAPSQLDAAASLLFQYPAVADVLPLFSTAIDWKRVTAADPELNRRLTLDQTTADIGSRVFTQGKIGLDADADAIDNDYSSDGLGRNYQTELKLGPSYDLSTLTEISAEVVGGVGAEDGNVAGMASVRDRSEGFNLRIRGEIYPKLTSTVFAGFTHVDYSGGFVGSSTLPTTGGDLVWAISPGTTLQGGVALGNGFAPDGDVQRTERATLDFRKGLAESWNVDFLLQPVRYSDRNLSYSRTDSNISAGVALEYKPSERFDLSVAYSAMVQSSNIPLAVFSRHLFSIHAEIHL